MCTDVGAAHYVPSITDRASEGLIKVMIC